jgi:SAM-dependent methyltransferase
MNHADVRYLESKRSVDDRALSRRVRDRLRSSLPPDPRVVDVGCGTGSTLARLHEWGVTDGSYRGIDRDARAVAFARSVRPAAFRRSETAVTTTGSGFVVDDLSASFETGDAFEALARDGEDADLFVAAAFADLVPLDSLVDAAESVLRPDGLAYFPITFDGGTIFQPDHPADDAVERAYHRAIDRKSGRDSRAGRRLADLLRRRDGDLVAMAASDWVVRPRSGEYRDDEAYFLSCILDFVDDALSGTEDGPARVDDWLSTRRKQLASNDLTYVAHQYDLLYRK